MMSTRQYDKIGEAFEGFKALPLTHYAEVPSVLALVGDVRGRSVLDLASGTGFYSREFKRRGATEVLGIDVSDEMVAAAREMERSEPLGVRYEIGGIAELPSWAAPSMSRSPFNCSTTPKASRPWSGCAATCTGTWRPAESSSSSARTPTTASTGPSLKKYGFLCEATGETGGTGPRVRVTALLDPPIRIEADCPRRDVYETCLRAAGFSDPTWVPLKISEAGRRAFDSEFWADHDANPPLEMLRCRA
ncbi:class I SAM-dependent methyltransferase [Streptomyces parvus]|uniref:class I SAM-dependent methyltransferase n=1 Tax=Streptomyces parvus TaxID=66428 RepID=UPI0034297F64